MPKQFVDIFNDNTNLFEQTLLRVKNVFYEDPIIISNKDQRFDVLNNVKKNKIYFIVLIFYNINIYSINIYSINN